MNAPIRRIAVVCLALFVALLINADVVQFAKAKGLRDKPGNVRLLYAQYDRQRGDILTAPNSFNRIATSKPTTDALKYLRTYPNALPFAPVTGFYSVIYGDTGIEQAENSFLAGTDDRLFVRQLGNLITGRTPQGGTVVTTIDPVLQQAAYSALNGRKGAVVAVDPSTGAILALVSSPSYDPNVLSSHDRNAIAQSWKQLNADPNQPMLDRALNQTYPPGSTFKLVTAAAALSSNQYNPQTVIPAPPTLPYPNSSLSLKNFQGESCGGQTTLLQALTISCNTAFGGLGETLGQDALRKQAEAFGFDSTFSVPMKSAPSVFPADLDAAQTIQSAIGQFNVRATPLQMAMIAASIGNGGTMMKPYLVQELVGTKFNIIDETKPTELRQAVSSQVAAQLSQMMQSVVEHGTGTTARIPGVAVAGKTGTAENAAGKPPHAWFVAFAPAVQPRIAIAVVVENGGGVNDATGGAVAAPIAKAVIQAKLKEQP